MSMVFNYYAFGTSDINDILYNLKDKLSENGWTIDYDKISSEGKLAFHVTDTQCYFTFYISPNYQDLGENKENHFHPYAISANTGVDTGNWYSPVLSYPIPTTGYSSYFVTTNSYCLANSKFCILILEGYTYHNPDYTYCTIYMFGQLDIPNEDLQGGFVWVVPTYCGTTERDRIGIGPSYQIGTYYKDTFCKPNTIESSTFKYFYGLEYFYYGLERTYPEQQGAGYSVIGELPALIAQPYQFGRLYLRTLIIYHKYEQDGVTYIHPIAETPFYLCKYRGIEWYNKTITYNTRKFKVYPLAGQGIAYTSNYGIAFEVGNL